MAGIYINDLTISLLDLDDPHGCSGHGKRTKGKGKGRYAPLLYGAPGIVNENRDGKLRT